MFYLLRFWYDRLFFTVANQSHGCLTDLSDRVVGGTCDPINFTALNAYKIWISNLACIFPETVATWPFKKFLERACVHVMWHQKFHLVEICNQFEINTKTEIESESINQLGVLRHRPICSVAPSITRLSATKFPIFSSSSVAVESWISGSAWSTSTSASKWDLWITPSPNVRGMLGFTCAVNRHTDR